LKRTGIIDVGVRHLMFSKHLELGADSRDDRIANPNVPLFEPYHNAGGVQVIGTVTSGSVSLP
jgi:hypothetical protein